MIYEGIGSTIRFADIIQSKLKYYLQIDETITDTVILISLI